MIRRAAIIIFLAVVIGTILLLHRSHAATVFSSDRFVRFFERQNGVTPGSTRVIPDVGSTFLYRGTEINGRHYTIHIDRLD